MKEFLKYQHILRLSDGKIDGLLNGTVHIFPKLDGTNCQIWFDGEKICCGSRNRALVESEPDHSHFRQTFENDARLVKFFKKYPNYRLYGEFLISHIVKYQKDAYAKFYIFDVTVDEGQTYTMRENGQDVTKKYERYLTFDEYSSILEEFNLDFIPRLAKLQNPTKEDLAHYLELTTYLTLDGKAGEGIVIKNYDYRCPRQGNVPIWGKIVRAEYQQNHKQREKNSAAPQDTSMEEAIVAEFVSLALIEKERAKCVELDGYWDTKNFSKVLQEVWYELINDSMFMILKKYKNPTINFRVLNKLVADKVRSILIN